MLAALDQRDRTGLGQHVDLSQIECGIQFLAPQVLEYTIGGNVSQRMGNRTAYAAPHGVFPCLGEERWVAVVVESDAHWAALVGRLGSPAWAADPALACVEGRLARQDELEAALAEWTSQRDGAAIVELLQAAGVPSAVVHPALDLFDDPQLAHRQHFVPLDHSEMGVWQYDELAFKLSETPSTLRTAAPLLGEHTELVLKDFLGYADADYQALVDAGALR